MGEISTQATKNYLSGLVIGGEIVEGLAFVAETFDASERENLPIVVCGDAALRERYAMALGCFGLTARELDASEVVRGLSVLLSAIVR